MLGQHAEITYEVPGQDIVDKLIERAAAAEKALQEMKRTNDGKPPENSCERGLFEAAQRDVETFRLRAQYLDADRSYTVTASTLEDVFIVRDHSGEYNRPEQPAAMAERRW